MALEDLLFVLTDAMVTGIPGLPGMSASVLKKAIRAYAAGDYGVLVSTAVEIKT